MRIARKGILLSAAAIISVLLLYIGRVQAALILRLVTGGAVAAYLALPLSRWFSGRFHANRCCSILLTYLAAGLAAVLLTVLLLPPLVRQMRDLIAALPTFAETARSQVRKINRLLQEKGFSRLSLPDFNWESLISSLPPILGGTASFAGSVVSRFTELTLSLMLGYYFLRDRERLALHMELLVPSAFRKTALQMASAVHREIGAFLRGQLLISLIVAVLSSIALMLAGVRAFLALGLIVGVFNLIPYFGPLLGAIPAVLMALTQGLDTALFAAVGLFIVQQLDSMVVSPRVMGALTGLHPVSVLLAITLGGSFSGLIGMLLAIPCLLAVRAVSRVWSLRSGKAE